MRSSQTSNAFEAHAQKLVLIPHSLHPIKTSIRIPLATDARPCLRCGFLSPSIHLAIYLSLSLSLFLACITRSYRLELFLALHRSRHGGATARPTRATDYEGTRQRGFFFSCSSSRRALESVMYLLREKRSWLLRY